LTEEIIDGLKVWNKFQIISAPDYLSVTKSEVMNTFSWAFWTFMSFFAIEHIPDNASQWTREEKPAANRSPSE